MAGAAATARTRTFPSTEFPKPIGMRFLVKALSGAGAVVRVDIDASDAAEARRLAAGQGLSVL